MNWMPGPFGFGPFDYAHGKQVRQGQHDIFSLLSVFSVGFLAKEN